MVKPRKFTATEWRDLARGSRCLAGKDDEAIERNKGTTIVPQFEESKRAHLEVAELCEYWAKQVKD